jgi:ABC-type glutathione transport system ATPase component
VLGLVGESGSGKTTLGLSQAGLTGYQGSISFHVPDRYRGRKVLPRVQVVFQGADASLNPRRTVAAVLERSIKLLRGTQTVEELAGRTGLTEELLGKPPHQLSVVRQVSDRIGVLYDGELVELKAASEIFERPEHPYTQVLVESALSLGRSRR